jgi:CubicO group peptidase (beta-lactamase class C family)
MPFRRLVQRQCGVSFRRVLEGLCVIAGTVQAQDRCDRDASDAAARISRITARVFPAVILEGDTIDRSLATRMRALNVPGIQVAVIDQGRIAWTRGFGVRDTTSNAPVTADTRFQAASLSKPIATLGVMRAVAQGKLGLDDDIRTRLTSWTLPPSPNLDSGTVTPRLLLSHRAGIAISGFLGYAQSESVPTLAQILAGQRPANHAALVVNAVPGRDNRYSGGGYTVMEQVLQDVTGTDFITYLQREVLTPLGMRRSTYATLSPNAPDDIARGYFADGRPVKDGWRTHPEHAAASLWTTACDYSRAILAMQRATGVAGSGAAGRVLSPELVKAMMVLQAPNQGVGVGLKGAPTPFRFSHTGSNVGYKAIMMGFLDRPQGAVVLTNGDNGGELMNDVIRAIAEEYQWNDMRPARRRAVAVDSARLQSAVGRYTLAPGREVELTWRNSALWAAPAGRAPQRAFAQDDSTLGFLFDPEFIVRLRRDGTGAVKSVGWGSAASLADAPRVPPAPTP